MSVYRGMDHAALDVAYNNSAAVANSPQILADWQKRSDELAQARSENLDLRYGPRERNRIDYFDSGRSNAPVLAFIHGGYWQMRAKEAFRFVASGPLAHGIDVALIGYTLAPEASLREIVDEVHTAITWLAENSNRFGGDAKRLYVSGWSAGGHLTAMSLAHRAMRGGLAISGIYDLEPIRLNYVNEKLKLDAGDVEPLSPQRNIISSSSPLFIAYGTAELGELKRQSRDYAAARAAAGLPGQLSPAPGHNHFTILEELASPVGSLTALVRELTRP